MKNRRSPVHPKRTQKTPPGRMGLSGQIQDRNKSFVVDRQRLQRLKQKRRCMASLHDRRAGQNLSGSRKQQIAAHLPHRIMKIVHDHVERSHGLNLGVRKTGLRNEKPGHFRPVQRNHRLRQTAGNRQRRNVGIPPNFDLRQRPPLPQRLQCRQRRDEIAYRPPAQNQKPRRMGSDGFRHPRPFLAQMPNARRQKHNASRQFGPAPSAARRVGTQKADMRLAEQPWMQHQRAPGNHPCIGEQYGNDSPT